MADVPHDLKQTNEQIKRCAFILSRKCLFCFLQQEHYQIGGFCAFCFVTRFCVIKKRLYNDENKMLFVV